MATGIPRFIPKLDGFKKKLLSLDFFGDIKDDQGDETEETEVPLYFDSEKQYEETFLPLFWHECRMQIQRAKETEMDTEGELVDHSKFQMDGVFVKLEVERGKETSRNTFFSQHDIAFFTQSTQTAASMDQTCQCHFIALVEQSYANKVTVSMRLEMGKSSGASKEASNRDVLVAKAISEGRQWRMCKVIGATTMIREYEALMSLPHIPLKGLILNKDDVGVRADTGIEMQADQQAASKQKLVSMSTSKLAIPDELSQWIKSAYNESQQKAIEDSRKVEGITLVQGPPGTGKTHTVLGILAVLLNSSAKERKAVNYTRTEVKPGGGDGDDDATSEEESDTEIERRRTERARLQRMRAPWMNGGYVPWADQLAQEVPLSGTEEWRNPFKKLGQKDLVGMSEVAADAAPKKVLVCAPSNAAIDEVLRRIVEIGIRDGTAKPKKRQVVRLGPNFHKSIEEFSLEHIVQRRLAASTDMPDAHQKEVEKEKVLAQAEIVCATLSIAGSRDLVSYQGVFDTVVMDEASQGVELAMLVPLKLGCRRLILVGDPKQLPATCFSNVAKYHRYDRSLFERLQESNYKVNMLQVQYRMHPFISKFPSDCFYEGLLTNYRDKEEFEKMLPTPWSIVPCFKPVVFFNLLGTMSVHKSSFINEEEANFCVQLYTVMSTLYPMPNWHSRLAVISPYAEQVKTIRTKFKEHFHSSRCPVDVNTVDGFQGREKDIIIFSSVRTHKAGKQGKQSIGFVRDRRRMNVAFTRSRTNLFVVGDSKVLFTNEDWRQFIREQQKGGGYLNMSKPYASFLPRFLTGWFDRHPEVTKPMDDHQFLDCHDKAEVDEGVANGAPEASYEMTPSEIEAMEQEDGDDEKREDIEELASEGDSAGEDEEGMEEDILMKVASDATQARGADLQMDGGDRKAGRDAGGADEDEEMAD